MARGGARTPRDPAPVSGPGALSQRTDGGASQPIRLAAGGGYGSRQALESQQASAPLAAGGPTSSSPAVPQGAPGGQVGMPDAFGPTQRPNELPTAGLGAATNQVFQVDPDTTLKALYAIYPHPDIARLISYQNAP